MKNTFRALSGRDFRLYFFGQAVSLVGTWVQQVAMSWIAYRVTGSAFMLGLIAFSGQIPALLLAPLGGVLADHLDRRKLLLATQVAAMSVATWLGFISFTGRFSEWVLVAASVLLGASSAIEMPTRQSFLMQLVRERSDATNAIALNSLSFHVARLVGPAVAGFALALVGETTCFVANAASYLAAIGTLLAVRPRVADHHRRGGPLGEALDYLRYFAPARWMLVTVAAASFCVAPMATLMPVFAKDVFRGGPDTLGLLMGASGLGAVFSALYLANRTTVIGLGERIGVACIIMGASTLAFAYVPWFGVAALVLVLSGAMTIVVATASNIILQHLVPDHLRGRVMSLFTMAFLGMMPVGALLAGWIARAASVHVAFSVSGIGALAVGIAFRRELPHLRAKARPVLVEKGLLSA